MDPFDDIDIAILIEAGIVRVDEFTRQPLLRIAADLELLVRLNAGIVVAKVKDRLVGFVE